MAHRMRLHHSIPALLAVALLPAAGSAQEIKVEKVAVAKLDPAQPRLYAVDIAINHIVDGRAYVLNPETLEMMGLIGTGFAGLFYAPKDRGEVYVATTYYPKLTRGDRSDWLEVYDTATLELKREIRLTPKRAQALNYRPLMQGSADGRFVFVQNATPATSISVVDLKTNRQSGEIPNPGCYGIYPSATNPSVFSTLCGDGAMRTYVLDKSAGKATQKASAKFFDADKDALFSHAERDGDTLWFASFTGNLYRVSIAGETAALEEKIPLADGIEGDWRPGGYQTHAFDAKAGIMYLLMHKGGAEGSHKNPGEEIWAFDVKAKKLLGRSPTPPATSLTILGGDKPALFAVNPVEATVIRFDVEAGGTVREAKSAKVGEAVLQLEAK
ncbi:amine dehydrogenase large subunit [Prosthecomicrobium sp. N25]|uniref:amine dehydrogenase large subunit n=1 Tax=Prosthecomicrobium sp. N25 TaxID=3129254 RepID=UPI003076D58A